jgi:pyruvate dehydrogenase E1 component alpha subunit
MPKATNRIPLDLYRLMARIRAFEERVGELYVRQGTAGSMLHLSIGEEGAAAGVGDAMEAGDGFTTHHRGHGIFLARGADPDRMMAEIAGKRTGYCRGKGGSMHIADMGLGHLGANAIVGGGIPAAVGAGLSYRRRGTGGVAVAFFGDGAMQQGILYESMNMAALWRLPVLFVCVNNQYGMGTRIDRASANLAWDLRARSFGLEAESVDGVDVLAVRAAADRLLAVAREGRPGFLAVSCYRFYGHARMDKSPYRTEEEESEGRGRDPLARLGRDLVADGVAEAELEAIRDAAGREMDGAMEFALASPQPGSEELFEDVYGPGEPRPVPVRDRIAAILAGGKA